MNDHSLLGVRIKKETHRALKVWCAKLGVQMSEVVRSLVEGWIEEQEAAQAENKKGGIVNDRGS